MAQDGEVPSGAGAQPGEESIVPDRPPDVSLYLGFARDGALRHTYLGPAFEGEDGSEPVAQSFVHHLNQNGGGWSTPVRPERENGADYESTGPNGTLRLQVTRVPHDPARWGVLSRDGHIAGDVDVPAIAHDLIVAVRNKARKLGPGGASGFTLVLDGSSNLAYVLANTLNISTAILVRSRKHSDSRASGS